MRGGKGRRGAIEVGRVGGVTTIRLSRPPVNALDATLKEELLEVVSAVSGDAGARAVVLTGHRVFSAGDDIKEMATLDPGYALAGGERISEVCSAVAAIPVPVVAAVTGFALGGGCELALAADLRVTASDASWGLPEVLLGLIPAGGGTQRLTRLVGAAAAKRLIYLGRPISGEEAMGIGLADYAVPADQVLATALDLAEELASRAPLAVRAAKIAIDACAEPGGGLTTESRLFAELFGSRDARTGLASFLTDGPGKATFEGR
jgi:enoyl-CoA hydratase/carnithine racemase